MWGIKIDVEAIQEDTLCPKKLAVTSFFGHQKHLTRDQFERQVQPAETIKQSSRFQIEWPFSKK